MKKFLFVTVLVCFPIFGMLACNSLNNSPASPFSATSPNNGGTSPSTPGSPQNTPTFTNTLQPGVPTYTLPIHPQKHKHLFQVGQQIRLLLHLLKQLPCIHRVYPVLVL